MSANKPDNPPAFPLYPGNGFPQQRGMTLRDWFAGQALAGLVTLRVNIGDEKEANGDWKAGNYYQLKSQSGASEESWADMLAGDAYDIADAMLAAREGKQ